MGGGDVSDAGLGLNARAARMVREMVADAARLGLAVSTLPCGATVVDAGAAVAGSLEGGRRFAEVCLGGLGRVDLTHVAIDDLWLPAVSVAADRPAISCLGSQYAGWQVKGPPEEASFFAMGSGPARALARREEIFKDLDYEEQGAEAVLLLETATLPGDAVAREVAAKCGVEPVGLYLVAARTASLAGSVQISARVVETALHKLHTLGYDVRRVIAGTGTCPLAPVARGDMRAIGRTNDCVLYGGRVFLTVQDDDAAIRAAVEQLPSSSSRDYGTPFYDLFKRYDNDFYKIDPALFSPAEVYVNNLSSGHTFHAGRLNRDVLRASLLTQA